MTVIMKTFCGSVDSTFKMQMWDHECHSKFLLLVFCSLSLSLSLHLIAYSLTLFVSFSVRYYVLLKSIYSCWMGPNNSLQPATQWLAQLHMSWPDTAPAGTQRGTCSMLYKCCSLCSPTQSIFYIGGGGGQIQWYRLLRYTKIRLHIYICMLLCIHKLWF